MDLVERYIYAVTKRLPEKQRGDIEKELRSIIEDMMEQYKETEPKDLIIQKVLLELGDPVLLADNYREAKRYLIGPQYFDKYMLVLKIVFGAVFLGISISTVIGSIFSEQHKIMEALAGYIGGLFSGLAQGFVWVTGIFAAAEYYGVKLMDDEAEKHSWCLSELPQIPEKKAVISKSESIISIMFSTIFAIIFWSASQLIAAYIPNGQGGLAIIPVFDISVIFGYRILILATFILSVLKEILKLIYGKWTLRLSILVTALSLASLALTVAILSNPNIWNDRFAADIMLHLNLNYDFASIWKMVTSKVAVLFVIAYTIEAISVVYKGIKYK